MSKIIDKARKDFYNEYGLGHEKQFYNNEENSKLNDIVKIGEEDERDKILESYDYEFDVTKEKYNFYKKIPLEDSREDLDQFIKIKMLEYARATSQNTASIKHIMVFWIILMIINFLLGILTIGGGFR